MPAIVAASIIGGVAGLGAAKIQSSAASKAQKAQQDATDKALAVQQQTSAPYRALGQTGIDRLNALGPPQPYTQQFRPAAGVPNQSSNGFQPTQGPPPTLGGIGMQQPDSGRLVTLQAPDGSTRQFPMLEADRVMQQARAQGHELRMVR